MFIQPVPRSCLVSAVYSFNQKNQLTSEKTQACFPETKPSGLGLGRFGSFIRPPPPSERLWESLVRGERLSGEEPPMGERSSISHTSSLVIQAITASPEFDALTTTSLNITVFSAFLNFLCNDATIQHRLPNNRPH